MRIFEIDWTLEVRERENRIKKESQVPGLVEFIVTQHNRQELCGDFKTVELYENVIFFPVKMRNNYYL